MSHIVKFAISAVFMLLGLWAFLLLPFWKGTFALFAISLLGHGIAAFVFKRLASEEDLKRDLRARMDND